MSDVSKLFDERLDVQPPMDAERLAGVPARRGVVLLAGENDEPIVLLTAGDMRSRLRTRLAERTGQDMPFPPTKSADLRQITRRVYYQPCDSRFEADWRFLELARQLWPTRYEKLISWKPPWFLHIRLEDAHPHFRRTREVFAREGTYLGPFADARSAETFLEALQDAFDLCRSVSCLRRAPNGPRCPYAEMGRCVSPADGTISMAEYRQVLAGALAFAAGDRQSRWDDLTQRMKQAAQAMRFEEAAALKARRDRLEFFRREEFAHVRPAEAFAYLLAPRSLSRRQRRMFLVWRGEIVYAGEMRRPVTAENLQGVLDRMKALSAESPPCDTAARLRMGLVARSLFDAPAERGLAVPWSPSLTAAALAEAWNASFDRTEAPSPETE